MAEKSSTMLTELATLVRQKDRTVFDITKARYVIYARKSTDENRKQMYSIDDQIKVCRKYAREHNLTLTGEPIIERKSAKLAGQRPLFNKMLQDFEAGRIDGIIAWHPDRLARNMKEAGEIIDLIDRDIIKDLAFVSFMFENSPSGKMLLGFAFTMAKEYSDKLSVNVKRGQSNRVEQGQWIADTKLGYYKDRNQYAYPEMEFGTFRLIEQAWQMRLNGDTQADIAKFLNENNFKKATRNYHDKSRPPEERMKPWKATNQNMSSLFADPFYAGIACYGEQVVNLADFVDFYKFEPVVTEEEFLQINPTYGDKQKYMRRIRAASKNDNKVYLLKGKVICGHCGEVMYRDLGSKVIKGQEEKRIYYRFRCDNKKCKAYGKTIRSKVIIDFVKEYLANNPFDSREMYEHYKKEIASDNKKKVVDISSLIRSLENDKQNTLKVIEEIDQVIKSNPTNRGVIDYYYRNMMDKQAEVVELEERIVQTIEKRRTLKQAVCTYERFLELTHKIPDRFAQITDLEELDWYIKKIFSNFTIKDKKVAMYTLQSPLKELAEQGIIQKCRTDRT